MNQSMEDKERNEQEEIHSKVMRAGRRTYFFDVRSTKADDFYLTITESKKFTNEDGSSHYKKHKIYLYKEDFHEFSDHLKDAIDFIFKERGEDVISDYEAPAQVSEEKEENKFTDVDFEDI